jgi:hypothetical protein
MYQIIRILKCTVGLILLLILHTLGCKKDSDYRAKYFGDFLFTIHMDTWYTGGTHIDSVYVKNGRISEGNSSNTIAFYWNGGARPLVELLKDGTFSSIDCKGEFTDVNTVNFIAFWSATSGNITYNITGTRY